MAVYKIIFIRAILVLCCLVLPPPGLVLAAPEAPWDDSTAPFVMRNQWIDVTSDQRVGRALSLEGTNGFRVGAGHTLWLDGPILGHPAQPSLLTPFWKLGGGHLELTTASTPRGQIVLAEGSLGLGHDDALGSPANDLEMVAGTRLELRPGVRIGQTLQVRSAATAQALPSDWGLAPITGLSDTAVWRVESGEAALGGSILAQAPILKDGAGTLRLSGAGFSINRDPLTLAQGGLRVDHLWWGPVLSLPGTVLSGVGQVDEARVAGWLQPGEPDQTGTLLIGQRLTLLPGARTWIRIGADGQADGIWSFGTARLGGELWVEPAPGIWTADRRWVIVQADGGLDYGVDGSADPVPGDGRYARLVSTLRYLDPVLDYGANTVTLGFQYNARGLNTADASWRAALMDDSRFLRDTARSHTADGRAWAQGWSANTERSGTDGLPGDDRDTSGLQMGLSRAVGPHGALAAFAGLQETRLGTGPAALRPGAVGGSYRVRDESWHLGLGASLAAGGWHLTLGAAHAWHRARIDRQADSAESPLHSRPAARMMQAWLHVQPAQSLPLGSWQIRPYAQAVWLRLHRTVTAENGGLAAVDLAAQTDRRWLGQLGMRIERPWATQHGHARMALDLGVQQWWGGTTLSSTQAYRADPSRSFETQGLPLPRQALRLDLGVQAPITRHAQISLAYTGQHGGGQMQHGIWMGVRAAFRSLD